MDLLGLFTAFTAVDARTKTIFIVVTLLLVLLGAVIWFFGAWAFGHVPIRFQKKIARFRPLPFPAVRVSLSFDAFFLP